MQSSSRKVKARTANELASLFLIQKLVQEKKRVRALQRGPSAQSASFSDTRSNRHFPTIGRTRIRVKTIHKAICDILGRKGFLSDALWQEIFLLVVPHTGMSFG